MPSYDHICGKCNKEFEEFYSIKSPALTKCSLCGKEGFVKRLVSGGSGRGIVELAGFELKEKIKSDGEQLKRDVLKNENLLENVVGPSYNTKVSTYERQLNDLGRPKIRSKKS